MEVIGQLHVPETLPSRKSVPGPRCVGVCVDARVGLDVMEKRKIPCSHPDSKIDSSVQHIALSPILTEQSY
jgi:hypothetical protein